MPPPAAPAAAPAERRTSAGGRATHAHPELWSRNAQMIGALPLSR
eukprot:gene20304-39666_t